MKVKDLITLLQSVNPEKKVILQKDQEGNGYSPLRGIDKNTIYVEEGRCGGTVFIETLTDDLKSKGYTEEDAGGDFSVEERISSLVLFP